MCQDIVNGLKNQITININLMFSDCQRKTFKKSSKKLAKKKIACQKQLNDWQHFFCNSIVIWDRDRACGE